MPPLPQKKFQKVTFFSNCAENRGYFFDSCALYHSVFLTPETQKNAFFFTNCGYNTVHFSDSWALHYSVFLLIFKSLSYIIDAI